MMGLMERNNYASNKYPSARLQSFARPVRQPAVEAQGPSGAALFKVRRHNVPEIAMGLVRWQEADLIVSMLTIVDSIDSHIYAIRWSRRSSRN